MGMSTDKYAQFIIFFEYHNLCYFYQKGVLVFQKKLVQNKIK